VLREGGRERGEKEEEIDGGCVFFKEGGEGKGRDGRTELRNENSRSSETFEKPCAYSLHDY